MQDSSENKDFIGDYDLSRTDKRFCIKIPRYSMEDGVVLYEIVLKDLVNNEVFLCSYRFKELKAINDELIDLKVSFADLVRPAAFPQNSLLDQNQ